MCVAEMLFEVDSRKRMNLEARPSNSCVDLGSAFNFLSLCLSICRAELW